MEEEEERLLLVNDGVVVTVSEVVKGVLVIDKSIFFSVVLLGECNKSFEEVWEALKESCTVNADMVN